MLPKLKSTIFAACALALSAVSVTPAQTRPLLQDIQVYRPAPTPTATPLVRTTSSSKVVPTVAVNSVRTMFPILSDLTVPGYSGILIENMEGGVVMETNPEALFNPASNVKVATAYAVLKTFGPDFRFTTNIYTDGSIDRTTGTLNGNLYVSGKDPVFGYEHAVSIANELNRLGVRSVSGDLIVTDNFAMNYSGSSLRSAETLFATMDAAKRTPAANRVWLNYLTNSGRYSSVTSQPGVTFSGAVYVQPIPSNARILFSHESAAMRDILKVTLCYSNNFLAERLGEMVGGSYAVARLIHQNVGVSPNEFSLATSSGLGYNRVSPNAMMKLLRALRQDLARYRMTFADIMPVAGLDAGTLENRFDNDFFAGSVIGKTGTLGQTDSGVSSLAGEINTRNGKLLFVIFNQRGSVPRFRNYQNTLVSLVQGQFGGPVSTGYAPMPLDRRLATSRISYPRAVAAY